MCVSHQRLSGFPEKGPDFWIPNHYFSQRFCLSRIPKHYFSQRFVRHSSQITVISQDLCPSGIPNHHFFHRFCPSLPNRYFSQGSQGILCGREFPGKFGELPGKSVNFSIALHSTVREVPGKSQRSFRRSVWGNSGKSRNFPEALRKSDSLPASCQNCLQFSRSETWVPKRGGLKPAGKRQQSATFLQRSFFDVAVQFFACCTAAFGPNDFRTAEKPMLQCSSCSAALRKLQCNFRFRLWHVAGVGFRGVRFRTC